MAAPVATTPQQSAALDRRINELDLRGHSSTEIVAVLAGEGIVLTPRAVQIRLKKLNEAARLDRDAQIERELRTLDYVQAQAVEAWEQSKLPGVTSRREWGTGPEGGIRKVQRTTEYQTGDPSHLGNVVKASESRRKLLGLDAPAKVRQEESPPIDWERVPEDVQIAFLEGKISLADVVKRLQPRS